MSGFDAPDRPDRLRVPVSEDDWTRGAENAPVTLVEYTDYECPLCRAAHSVVERLFEAEGSRIRFAVRHVPLVSRHEHAMDAAMAAEAAGRQGKFWEMHERLFRDPPQLERDDLLRHAGELGLDVERFQADLDNEDLARKIREQKREGVRSGLNTTPTFFINGERYDGPQDFEGLSKAVRDAAGNRQETG